MLTERRTINNQPLLMSGKIIVIGSTNTDMVIQSPKLPLPGETILGGQFFMFPGGKGANQAVAAARLGGDVTLVARTGDDVFGRQAVAQFQQEGIRTNFVSTDADQPSGVALIMVDSRGENSIAVAPGANASLRKSDIDRAGKELEAAEVGLLQLEIPLDTVVYAIERLYGYGAKVILNPAPARPLPAEVYPHLHIITPNETEAEILTGVRVTDTITCRPRRPGAAPERGSAGGPYTGRQRRLRLLGPVYRHGRRPGGGGPGYDGGRGRVQRCVGRGNGR
jgi:ribokinase